MPARGEARMYLPAPPRRGCGRCKTAPRAPPSPDLRPTEPSAFHRLLLLSLPPSAARERSASPRRSSFPPPPAAPPFSPPASSGPPPPSSPSSAPSPVSRGSNRAAPPPHPGTAPLSPGRAGDYAQIASALSLFAAARAVGELPGSADGPSRRLPAAADQTGPRPPALIEGASSSLPSQEGPEEVRA